MRKTIIFLFSIILLFPVTKAVADSPDIPPLPGQVDPYRTRSELLMDATAYTGVFTPEQAASVWAKGLEMRSAAMQYTVMTDKLKKEYAEQLDALRSNWVTGESSPSVMSYAFKKVNKTDESHAEIILQIKVGSYHDPTEYYAARLWLVREEEFWRIDRIAADEGLYYYTLYKP